MKEALERILEITCSVDELPSDPRYMVLDELLKQAQRMDECLTEIHLLAQDAIVEFNKKQNEDE